MSYNLKEVIGKDKITTRVKELAAEISRHYGEEPLVMVCVLKGAFIFFADLVRAVDIPMEVDFVRLASYGEKDTPDEQIVMTKDVETALTGKHVLVIEDIVDTGHSMRFLLEHLQNYGPKSLKLCTMVDKTERRQAEVNADFVGFKLHKGFLVGYGLDYAEKYRELSGIYELVR